MLIPIALRAATRRSAVALIGGLALSSGGVALCQTNPYYNPAKPHHTHDGFRNNYAPVVDKDLGAVLRWRWEAARDGLPRAPAQPTPVQAPDLTGIHANAVAGLRMRPAITWIGHATTLVQAGGLNVLTDPVFSERASPVQLIGPQRAQPPGVALDELPAIDVVLISHDHYDHLDRNSVVALNQRASGATLFLVPLGLRPWMQNQGVSNVLELDWWDRIVLQRQADGRVVRLPDDAGQATPDAVEFHLTPVQHWSARGLSDRRRTLWGGWAVFGADFHWYYSGDTGYSRDFEDIAAHFSSRNPGGFDLALLPIGAYAPRWFMKEQHINPAEALQIHKDLRARRSVGVHWGTFNLTDEPLDQPPIDLAAARRAQRVPEEDFFLLRIGETRILPRRQAGPAPVHAANAAALERTAANTPLR